jgi:hypothetical protein
LKRRKSSRDESWPADFRKLLLAKQLKKMKKFINIENAIELMEKLWNSKRVEGVLFIDKNTGKLTFKAYNRLPANRRPKDRLICELEHGWLRESPQRYKVFTSVKKSLGAVRVTQAMRRDLERVTSELYLEEVLSD